MRVREEESGGGETVEIRRLYLRLAAESANPVVPVIDGDHEDIRTAELSGGEDGGGEKGAARHGEHSIGDWGGPYAGIYSLMEGNMVRIQLILLLGIAVAVGQEKTPRKLISSLDGKDLFMAYCASCHGLDAKGHGPVAPALKEPLPDLRTVAKRNNGTFPKEEMEKMILGGKGSRVAHGSEDMPVWGPVFRKVQNDRDLGLVRVRNVVDYLVSIQVK